MPWSPTGPLTSSASPARISPNAEAQRGIAHADAARVQIDAAAFAARHDLGVAGGDDDTDLARGGGDAGDDALEHGELEAFFEQHAEAQVLRHRACDREVVGRAVHGERTDVAARELDRLHREAVGREREVAVRRVPGQHRRIGVRIEQRIARGAARRSPRSVRACSGRRCRAPARRGYPASSGSCSSSCRWPIAATGTRASSFQASSSARMCSRICSRTWFTELKNSAIMRTQQYMPRRVRRIASASWRVAPSRRIVSKLGRHQIERPAVAARDVVASQLAAEQPDKVVVAHAFLDATGRAA